MNTYLEIDLKKNINAKLYCLVIGQEKVIPLSELVKDKQVHRVSLLLKKELVKVTIFLHVFYGLVTFMYNDVLLDSG